jgi:hypothetical protein
MSTAMTVGHAGEFLTESEPLFAAYGCRRHGPEQTQKSPQALFDDHPQQPEPAAEI